MLRGLGGGFVLQASTPTVVWGVPAIEASWLLPRRMGGSPSLPASVDVLGLRNRQLLTVAGRPLLNKSERQR